ncbi:uncharacterized protein A1O9_10034 [Exophiala aquamarina CBS 119918]|uniref:Phosphoglycolate phosphatase n=1 Tax=Exophiala aquamarina CBS 119918 TaxID=1182545 RepID=A0A072P0H0_9EURO|nr:uncharacterized protein A1O9_10034 [Exophiala aquamarina CBS 119918]KEF53634.1 hypothetical protein A1O9_10034 [Exophiala aquamarina CBS 119918]
MAATNDSYRADEPDWQRGKQRPRAFAPLNPNKQDPHQRQKLRGIIFDVDGTLCLPQNYMFKEMRAALNISRSVDILDHIHDLSDVPDSTSSNAESQSSINPSAPSEEVLSHSTLTPAPAPTSPRARAVAKIRNIERTAMTSQRPQPGLQQLMAYLSSRGIPKALCTRNFPAPVHHLLDKFLDGEVFEPIITRDSEGIAPKPSPEGLWSIAHAWGLDKDIDASGADLQQSGTVDVDPLNLAKRYLGSGLIMVGDSIDDMTAGRRAGAATVLLANDENEHLAEHECTDLSIRRLDELIDVLEKGFQARK